mmetsp:Transcript_36104/g.36782  ORF Transcript_36104/g.36782 Transcript_36104/m.36782 type:complete len:499 (-) Transcript_36104:130-1626(-)|eukprot:CAMPEP_0182435112 /NCGR_PEP_ID=MMETSP1167-20130531/73814_1 /TAXON_ID=2988 /ORGANISM="Mallomonas Sp, Strain CCMP3275" /LENGTH=498 /DNA_ID=CAMNT_0024625783 /DNA_START=242 /DNA_END=1738 /DNA_ORIENTATION=+
MADIPKEPRKKVYLPFGTPIHGKHPYSEYAHLSGENRDFAVQITTPQVPRDPKFLFDIAPTVAPTKKIVAKEQPIGDGTAKPCIRPECKEVIRKIGEAQDRNMRERDHILAESKRLLTELDQSEQILSMIETEQKQLTLDSSQLEKTLAQIGESFKNLEEQKREQQQERDELNNKVMTFEAEKQRWSGRLQRAEEALADMLWKRDASSKEEEEGGKIQPQLQIVAPRRVRRNSNGHIDPSGDRGREKEKEVNDEERTDYSVLVRPDVLDYCELPLRSASSAASVRQIRRLAASASGSQSRRGPVSLARTSLSSLTSHGDMDYLGRGPSSYKSGSIPATPVRHLNAIRNPTPGKHKHSKRKPLTNPLDGSLLLDLPDGAYRGYTPSGGRLGHLTDSNDGYTRASTTGSLARPTVSSLGDDSAAETWHALDPVFYAENSRASWGRKDQKGVVRLRRDPPGFRRKLLTAKGHPGIFTHGDFEDFPVDLKALAHTAPVHSET